MKNWKKDSWKDCTIKHVPPYKDQEKLDKIIARLNTFPPLVFAGAVSYTHLRAHET